MGGGKAGLASAPSVPITTMLSCLPRDGEGDEGRAKKDMRAPSDHSALSRYHRARGARRGGRFFWHGQMRASIGCASLVCAGLSGVGRCGSDRERLQRDEGRPKARSRK